ncbi:MAG: arginase family protein [Pleurocapsa sp. MO_226.B13]|nr:arginase family protein [Pleurocapsa sp. MO_226.B13]
MMLSLNLLFPQWQGSGISNELYHGAMSIHDRLKNRSWFLQVPVPLNQTLKIENNILGYFPLLQQLSEAREMILQYNPDRLFVIGGDCSIDIAPISFLNQKYDRNLAVVWLDAHADLNTPASSPSHHFHGMPLRILLGEGDSEFIKLSFSVLTPNQVFLVGARDLDPPEKNCLQQKNISLFPPEKLEDNSQNLIEAIATSNYQNIHIHCDLDAIDPLEFPFVKCPAANGLSREFLSELLQQLESRFNLVGFSITEFAPRQKQGLEKIAGVVHQMFDLFDNY